MFESVWRISSQKDLSASRAVWIYHQQRVLTGPFTSFHMTYTGFVGKTKRAKKKHGSKSLEWNFRHVGLLVNLPLLQANFLGAFFLFGRSTRCLQGPEVAQCLLPSCQRSWRSCISTKTRAESRIECAPVPTWTKTLRHHLTSDRAVSDWCWTDDRFTHRSLKTASNYQWTPSHSSVACFIFVSLISLVYYF